jgi:hypothetical protein
VVGKPFVLHDDAFYEYFKLIRHPEAQYDLWGGHGASIMGLATWSKCCAPQLPRQFGEGDHGVFAGGIVPKTLTLFLKQSTKPLPFLMSCREQCTETLLNPECRETECLGLISKTYVITV